MTDRPSLEQSVRPVAVDAARRGLSRPRLLLLVVTLGAAAVAVASVRPGRDTVADGWDHSADAATAITWLPLLTLVLCTGLYYAAAAGALRSTTRARLPFGQTTAATLSASAANKLTPAGLGGSAVMARFLVRRGGVAAPEAIGSVGVLAVARASAAMLTLAALATLAPLIGVDGARGEIAGLLGRMASPRLLPWVAGVGGAIVLLAAAAAVRRRMTTDAVSRTSGWRETLDPLRLMVRQPRRLATLLGCSAGQSLVLSIAFAAATLVTPGPRPSVSLIALMAGYLVAAAVAVAIPVPGGIGSAEAALTAVLVAAHVPLGHALVDVTVFRVCTLWVPAGLGLLCAAGLRRRGSL